MPWTDHTATRQQMGVRSVVLTPAFVVELYGYETVASSARSVFERIWALFPDGDYFSIDKRGRQFKPLTKSALTRLTKSLDRVGEVGQSYMVKDTPDFGVDAYSLELTIDHLSGRVLVGLPVAWLSEVGPDAAIELFRSVVGPFSVGSAGFGFHLSWPRECEMVGMPANLAAGLQYWGLNVRNRGQEQYLGGTLKTAHWLTYVDGPTLAQLGGHAAARALEPEVAVLEAGAGVILRAGPTPPIGDVSLGAPDIGPMRRVNAFIKPIRIAEWGYASNLFFTEAARANAWVTRLD